MRGLVGFLLLVFGGVLYRTQSVDAGLDEHLLIAVTLIFAWTYLFLGLFDRD